MRFGAGAIFGVVVLALAGTLSSCGRRNEAPITPCIDGKPAIERIKDVAPPNCGPVGP